MGTSPRGCPDGRCVAVQFAHPRVDLLDAKNVLGVWGLEMGIITCAFSRWAGSLRRTTHAFVQCTLQMKQLGAPIQTFWNQGPQIIRKGL